MKALYAPLRVLSACVFLLPALSQAVYQQAVDIKDFFPLEPGQTWQMQGSAFYITTITFPINITTEVGEVLHEAQTTKVTMNAYIQGYGQTYQVWEELQLSYTDEYLLLHSRLGQRWLNGTLDDEDIETYNTPARILPRMVYIDEIYPFTADLTTGPVDDVVRMDGLENITAVGQQEMESLKMTAFVDGRLPITLWMVRDMGFGQAAFDVDLFGSNVVVTAILWEPPGAYYGEKFLTRWAETRDIGGGKRSSHWFGNLWMLHTDSEWIHHAGLHWLYCLGDQMGMWIYIEGAGWYYTDMEAYPWLYENARSRYLYYMHAEDSRWVGDPDTGTWTELGGT